MIRPLHPASAAGSSSRNGGDKQELAQQPGELLALPGIEGPEEPLLVLEVVDDGGVDELAAAIGQATRRPRRSVGSGWRSTRPIASRRSRRFVMAPDERMTELNRLVGFMR